MEEYARKPYYEREAIFCKKTILKIREALGFGRIMKITTQRQAENYFFKFGHQVKILEPQELADKFSRRYESAARQYR